MCKFSFPERERERERKRERDADTKEESTQDGECKNEICTGVEIWR